MVAKAGKIIKRIWTKAGVWIIWLILFTGTVVFASFYGGTVPYMLMEAVIAVPVVGAAYAIWVSCRFRYYQNITEKTVVKGEPVEYSLCISNEEHIEYGSIKPVFYHNRAKLVGVSEDVEYVLHKGEKKYFNTHMSCRYRGEYEVGVSHFIVKDYLGLITIKHKPASDFKLLVLPRVVPWVYEHEILDEKNGSNDSRVSHSGDIDVQVRNYVNGDSMRKIHWKASAKALRLLTREECETRNKGLLLVVDLHRQQLTQEECLEYEDTVIEQLVAAVHTCFVRHIPCTVLYWEGGWQKLEVETEEQWKDFYQKSGKILFTTAEPVERVNLRMIQINKIRYCVFISDTVTAGLDDLISHNLGRINTGIITVEGGNTRLHRL